MMDFKSKLQKNLPLAPLTTFKIGGPAKFYFGVKTKDDLVAALNWANDKNEKIYFLGGGSNLLINDKGVDGLVIKLSNHEIRVRGRRLECGAGLSLARATSTAISNNLSGLEWTVGIPGATIGGAVRGNAEAFGFAMANIVETIELFERNTRKFRIFSNKDCKFSYRSSVFKENDNCIIWSVVLKLKSEKQTTIQALVKQSVDFRSQNYPKLPSAGSIFRNIHYSEIKKRNPELAKRMYDAGLARLDNIGAGLIIDKFLDFKGKTIGGAKISLEHANHIVNTGKATAEDVIMLISVIKEKVRRNFNIQLQEEIQYFGFE